MPFIDISISPIYGTNSVRKINFGTSNPKLGGTINVSDFPLLQEVACNNNGITDVIGLNASPQIQNIQLQFNNLSFEINTFLSSLSTRTNLTFLAINGNGIRGNYLDLSVLPRLRTFRAYDNDMSGEIKSLLLNTQLTEITIHDNLFTGNLPSLSTCSNLQIFSCYSNTNLNGNFPDLSNNRVIRDFRINNNNFNGSFPNFRSLTAVNVFQAQENFFTGIVGSLSSMNVLNDFRFNNNLITGFAGGSVSINLGNFQAQNNQLPQNSIDTILKSFVTANRTASPKVLYLGGNGNSAPSYTGGSTTTIAGSNFSRVGTTVTVNVTNHGHTNGNLLTIIGTGGLQSGFIGTFVITVVNANQFRYTTLTSGNLTGTGTATIRKTNNTSDGYYSYQQLALVSRTGGAWDVQINQP
jgi:hypothetical protein